MKLSEILALVEKDGPAAAVKLKGVFGDNLDRDIVQALSDAAVVPQLRADLEKAGGEAKNVAGLKATLERRDGVLRERHLEAHFSQRAAEIGLNKDAIKLAIRAADLSGVKVDIETGAVTGLDKAVVDKLKAEAPILFAPAVSPVPPLPPAPSGAGAPAALKIDGSLGSLAAGFATAKQ